MLGGKKKEGEWDPLVGLKSESAHWRKGLNKIARGGKRNT